MDIIDAMLILIVDLTDVHVAILVPAVFLFGCIKKDRKIKKIAGYIAVCYLAFVGISLSLNTYLQDKYDSIEQISVEENRITLTNSQFEDYMGERSFYLLSDENLLSLIDEPSYSFFRYEKNGFTFEAKQQGEMYIWIVDFLGPDVNYSDVYRIDISHDKQIEVVSYEHLFETDQEVLSDYIVEEYGFDRKKVDKILK